jgi:hypothetical protein
MPRRPYPSEFRDQMVELVRSGRSPYSLSKEGFIAVFRVSWRPQSARPPAQAFSNPSPSSMMPSWPAPSPTRCSHSWRQGTS